MACLRINVACAVMAIGLGTSSSYTCGDAHSPASALASVGGTDRDLAGKLQCNNIINDLNVLKLKL
jgi:hypothetical protein